MFTPSKKILKKYADVLIKFALNSGKGVKKGEVVYVEVPESAKPFVEPLMVSILESGAYPMINYIPEGISKTFFQKADQKQLVFWPQKYMLARVDECDHIIRIISTDNKHELDTIDSKKIIMRQKAAKFYLDAREKKEYAGKMTWTVGLFGTSEQAKEAHLTLPEYWKQIIKACYLDAEDPITEWKKTALRIDKIRKKLNNIPIKKIHVKGKNVDLTIVMGRKRQWVGGSGRNIPSFEIFTSPDYRGTQGWVKFDQPVYTFGKFIDGIEFEFKDGLVIKSKAQKNEKLLKELVAVKNGNRIGEFSLTDIRFSHISKYMGEILYDENIGGTYGNFHIALGLSYKDCSILNPRVTKEKEWLKYGYNIDCAVHTDFISTERRVVTVTLSDGTEKIIYKDGKFNV